MAKAIGFLFLFIIFIVIKLIITGAKKAYDVSKDAYDAANSGEPFMDSFNRMRQQNKLSLPEAIIAMLTKIAKSDGHISQFEAEMISAVIDDFIGVIKQAHPTLDTTVYRQSLVNISNVAKNDSNDITYYAEVAKNESFQIKKMILTQLVALSSVDGYTSIQERMIRNVSTIFMFPSNTLNEIIDSFLNTKQEQYKGKDPYEVLGCSKEDDMSIIKKKYRELVKKFHPDLVQSQNLDDEFVKFATEKMKEINAAYEQIKKDKGC